MPSYKRLTLLMDKFAAHDKDSLAQDRVDMYCFPSNCTEIHQIMDAGVISASKARYQASLFTRNLAILPQTQQ